MRASSWLRLAILALALPSTRALASGPAANFERSHVLYSDASLHVIKTIQSIQVTVQSSVTFDQNTGVYTYSYLVRNESSSLAPLHTFGIGPVPHPISMGTPGHWDGGHPWEGDTTLAGWTVSDNDTGPLPLGDTGNVYASPYDLAPGNTQTGFALRSKRPPTTVQFFAQAFDTIAAGDDDIGPPPLNQEGITGNTIGPDITGLVSVPPGSTRTGIHFHTPSPNPAGSSVQLVVEVSVRSLVGIDVMDVRGRRLRILAHGFLDPGLHTVTWNGRNDAGDAAAPGVYFFRLTVDEHVAEQRRVTIIR